MERERRTFQIEFRAAGSKPRRLEGYAAIFGKETRVGDFSETVRAGAFAASLASGRDILALADHDPARVLGRTSSRTLRLAEDSRGLAFSLDLPDTQAANDILALAARNDLGGMSFGFTATDQKWNGDRRELCAVDLHEISVVSAWPAYDGTIVEARSALRREPVNSDLMRRFLELLRG
jgi:hypothetical protein